MQVNEYLDSLSEAFDTEVRTEGDETDLKVGKPAVDDMGVTLYVRRGCPYCCRVLLMLMEVTTEPGLGL